MESGPQRSCGDGDSAAAKFMAWKLWGFHMKPPQSVRKMPSLLSSVWISPPALLSTPGEDSQSLWAPPGWGRRMEHPWEIQHVVFILLLLWREKEAQEIYGLPVLPAGL